MRFATTVTVLALIPPVSQAAAENLKGSEISALVAGARVELDTPLGHRLPVVYHPDGRLSGTAGELASYLGSQSDTGRWWVSKDRLCHQWTKWFDKELQCLRLTKDGNRIEWQNQSGTGGTATIAAAAPAPAPSSALAARRATVAAGDGGEAARMNLASPRAESARTPAIPAAAASSQAPKSAAVKTPAAPLATTRNAPSDEPDAYRVVNVARDDVLNVREGPSADDDVVGTLQAEERGVRLSGSCRARWCPISHGDVAGWVNAAFIEPQHRDPERRSGKRLPSITSRDLVRDAPDAPRTCLTEPARALLDDIETRFGSVRLVSTCRPGARIAGTGRVSRHASGNAIDFDAGARKAEIVAWLVINHKAGGTMTYPDMDHVHADIGRHFVSLAGRRTRTTRHADGSRWSSGRVDVSSRRIR